MHHDTAETPLVSSHLEAAVAMFIAYEVTAPVMDSMAPDFHLFQTDAADTEKVATAFLKISSVFKDEAPVKTTVHETTGNSVSPSDGGYCGEPNQ